MYCPTLTHWQATTAAWDSARQNLGRGQDSVEPMLEGTRMVMAIVIEYTIDFFRVISLGPKPFGIQQVRRTLAHVDYDIAIVRRFIVCSGIGTQIASGPRLFVICSKPNNPRRSGHLPARN